MQGSEPLKGSPMLLPNTTLPCGTPANGCLLALCSVSEPLKGSETLHKKIPGNL